MIWDNTTCTMQKKEGYNIMIKFIDNQRLKIEIDKLLLDNEISKVELANIMGCKPQQVNNILNKKNFAFTDLKCWVDALNYDLYIDFKQKNN